MPDEYLEKLSYERRTDAWNRMLNDTESGAFHFVAENETGEIVGIASGGPERSGDAALVFTALRLRVRKQIFTSPRM